MSGNILDTIRIAISQFHKLQSKPIFNPIIITHPNPANFELSPYFLTDFEQVFRDDLLCPRTVLLIKLFEKCSYPPLAMLHPVRSIVYGS